MEIPRMKITNITSEDQLLGKKIWSKLSVITTDQGTAFLSNTSILERRCCFDSPNLAKTLICIVNVARLKEERHKHKNVSRQFKNLYWIIVFQNYIHCLKKVMSLKKTKQNIQFCQTL